MVVNEHGKDDERSSRRWRRKEPGVAVVRARERRPCDVRQKRAARDHGAEERTARKFEFLRRRGRRIGTAVAKMRVFVFHGGLLSDRFSKEVSSFNPLLRSGFPLILAARNRDCKFLAFFFLFFPFCSGGACRLAGTQYNAG